MRKLSPRQLEALKIVADGRFFPDLVREDDGWHARWRGISNGAASEESIDGWVDEYVRSAAVTRLSEDAEDQRHETLHDAWMLALRSRTGLVRWDDAECAQFAAELAEWSGAAQEDVAARAATSFTLVTEGQDFFITCAIPHGRRALKALGQSVYVFPPLRGLRRQGDGLRVPLSVAEAESFIRGAAAELRDAGYAVKGVDLAASVTASAEIATETNAKSVKGDDFTLTVKVAGEPVTAAEIRFLLDQGSSLVYFRDHWIEVDRDILRQALRALEKRGKEAVSPLAFALGIGRIGSLEIEEVKSHGWLRGLVNELRARRAESVGTVPGESQGTVPKESAGTVPGLTATLRPYQARGVKWMRFLTEHGFGALLADDMGLGKTIQTIAWILQGACPPVLVVAPLTLLSNWAHEFAKFAPKMKIYVHQGENRHIGSGFKQTAAAADVVITSYNLLVKDYTDISEVVWEALVLDEAQTIKNPDTRAAQAVRALLPPKRLALTGTPVENSVADIWSLEEFLNPGFLGDRRTFEERFVKPISEDESSLAAKRLKYALEPFVLRRLKSDPEIAAELGPKREIKEYCALSSAQRRDYEAALADFKGRERAQGDVFALITSLKLICDGEGKLERLYELLEGIFAAGESVLVFTQYAKVGAMLREKLAEKFGEAYPFLHGALGVKEREAAIRAFNRPGPRAFILSLKAGGFGLNLVKATHVVHFDRWWNPAAENQATDRAHRIGQTKTVFVHAFITAGTLEEHVDEILETKSRVAGTLISETEWLEAAELDE